MSGRAGWDFTDIYVLKIRGTKRWACDPRSRGPEDSFGAPGALRLPTDDGRVAASRNAGQPQKSGAAHARGQSYRHDLQSSSVSTEERRHEIYINLANRMKLTGVNQLWVADITFVRLKREFVYLAVVLDRFSRKVVGWNLERTLTARLPLGALEKALEERKPEPGLVHHSDRGAQYAHAAYLVTLHMHGVVASVSRPGSPSDNASCESFFRTLKREEVDAKEYRDLEDLWLNISEFIECYYNRIRLHSALGYRPPEEFEQVSISCRAASISSASRFELVR